MSGRGLSAQYPESSPAGRAPVELDWMQFAPQHATILDQTQSTGAKVDAAGGVGTVFMFDVPDDRTLRISGIGFGSLSLSAMVFATWKLTRNGVPIGDYYDVPCAFGSLARLGAVDVFVHGPARVELVVTNNYPKTAFRYSARMRGWLVTKVKG